MESDDAVFIEGRRIEVVNQPQQQLIAICYPDNQAGEYETIFRLGRFQRVTRDDFADKGSLAALTRWLLAYGADDLGPSDAAALDSLRAGPDALRAGPDALRAGPDITAAGTAKHIRESAWRPVLATASEDPPAPADALSDRAPTSATEAEPETSPPLRAEPIFESLKDHDSAWEAAHTQQTAIVNEASAVEPAADRGANASLQLAIATLTSLGHLELEIQRLLGDMRDMRTAVLGILTRLDLAIPVSPVPTAAPSVDVSVSASGGPMAPKVTIPVVMNADTPVTLSAVNLSRLVDTERLVTIRAETQRAQATLAALAALDEGSDWTPPRVRHAHEEEPVEGMSPGLLTLARELSQTDRFSLPEFRLRAERLGVVPLDAIRRINEWAVERSDAADEGIDAVIEVDERDESIWVDDYLKELLA